MMSLAESVKKIEQWIAKILPAEQPTAKGEGRKEGKGGKNGKGNGRKEIINRNEEQGKERKKEEKTARAKNNSGMEKGRESTKGRRVFCQAVTGEKRKRKEKERERSTNAFIHW